MLSLKQFCWSFGVSRTLFHCFFAGFGVCAKVTRESGTQDDFVCPGEALRDCHPPNLFNWPLFLLVLLKFQFALHFATDMTARECVNVFIHVGSHVLFSVVSMGCS